MQVSLLPLLPLKKIFWEMVFIKCTRCMLFPDIDPNNPQFTGITKSCSEKEPCVYLEFLFSLEGNCRIFCVV